MKYEIDKQILDATKQLILSEINFSRELYNKATDFDSRALLESSKQNLVCIYNNLDIHANKPKPIRKVGITSK